MGLFSKLFGRKQKKVFVNRLDLDFYEIVIDNIAVSDEFKVELKESLKIAFNDPKYYYDDSGDFSLSERGLRYPNDVSLTPKFVLVDKMLTVGQMTEVDWKEEEEEIRFSIIEIVKAKGYELHIATDDKYTLDTDEIISSINDNEIQPFGYSLEILDINSDSYVFTIVPADKKQLVRELFNKLK